ncbi:2TM domain-containing protein [Acidovorax sp. 62]|uniref:2TM domain-containing protein n=1 Tax=Acidovorax sp. 62 TaxID=2035203 RepID=UPI000C18E00C|nr:2TM domain-containing protein [Acidovorax sp. 62]PIF90030.1 2TM domain-containing protein [Acidovorax sp. 62]
MHPSEPLHASHPANHAEPTDALGRLARKRAGAKLGWYLHATLYVLVNVVLALLSSAHGKHWAIFPAMGWAIGLAAHGLAVFVLGSGSSLRERMVHTERERLQATHRPR